MPSGIGTLDALAVLEALPYGALIVQRDSVVARCNRGAHVLLGIEPDAVGRKFAELRISTAIPRLQDAVREVASGKPDTRITDTRVVVDGANRNVSFFLMSLYGAENRHQGVLVLAEDRTEYQRLTDELRTAQRTDLQKDSFLAMLAHELRNPLAAILNALHVVQRLATGDGRVTTALAIACRQVDQQSRLLDDLLDVSRIIHGRIELRRQPVDLVGLVSQALEASSFGVRLRAHRLDVWLPEHQVLIDGDPARLSQIVTNLVSNATKFTEPGGIITVQLKEEGEEATLTVADTGRGISPEMLPRVFDLFSQEDSSLARSQGGLGIGLTLVKRLVEMHGGRVVARSAGRGRGSEFEIRFPKAREIPEPGPQADAVDVSAARRILVIEDNRDARYALRLVLEMQGHTVKEAGDGRSGIRTAIAWLPDVILVDIGLPQVDGYEVARRIRRRLGDRTTLVALTGYGDAEARRRATDAGFDHHLVKPTPPDELARVLASI